ncbi:MoxR family ATPase [Candidatus Woesearchaeota archaeon]|nr:MoxR family ATPase [Candidatus Woesearchaeota archaeon]
MDAEIKKLTAQAEKHSKEVNKVIAEVSKVIVGQHDVLERLMIALIADGHILLEGVPGLAKTLMIRTLSDTMHSKFCRIQFTPDLLPADIIGTKIYDHKKTSFHTKKGPIFSNFILADEINRAPPKVQSALLEAMQEKQVTIQGETFPLTRPFLVMATQNPIETEGTYKLPEAQVDRFMFKLVIRYPEKGHEKEIIQRMTRGLEYKTKKVLTPEYVNKLQHFCTQIYCDEKIEDYVASIVDATRTPAKYKLDVDGHIEYGASPRASIWLVMAGKAHALLQGRGYVTPEDIQAVAYDVLRHRILLSYEAEAEDVTSDEIIGKILDKVKVP